MPVTIELPAEAHARLNAEAAWRGITLDQVIAQLAEHLPAQPTQIPRPKLAFVGARRPEPASAIPQARKRLGVLDRPVVTRPRSADQHTRSGFAAKSAAETAMRGLLAKIRAGRPTLSSAVLIAVHCDGPPHARRNDIMQLLPRHRLNRANCVNRQF